MVGSYYKEGCQVIPKSKILQEVFRISAAILAIVIAVGVASGLSGCSTYKTAPLGTTIQDNVIITVVDSMEGVKTCQRATDVYGCHFKRMGIHYIFSLPLESCIEHEKKHLTGWEHSEGYRDDCHRDAWIYKRDKRFI